MLGKVKIILVSLFMLIGTISFAQLTEPGGGDGSTPSDSGIAGGGAPIGSGLALILGLGLAYGAKKDFSTEVRRRIK